MQIFHEIKVVHAYHIIKAVANLLPVNGKKNKNAKVSYYFRISCLFEKATY